MDIEEDFEVAPIEDIPQARPTEGNNTRKKETIMNTPVSLPDVSPMTEVSTTRNMLLPLADQLTLLCEQSVLTNKALANLNNRLRAMEDAYSCIHRMEVQLEKLHELVREGYRKHNDVSKFAGQLEKLQARVSEREALFAQVEESQKSVRAWLAAEAKE